MLTKTSLDESQTRPTSQSLCFFSFNNTCAVFAGCKRNTVTWGFTEVLKFNLTHLQFSHFEPLDFLGFLHCSQPWNTGLKGQLCCWCNICSGNGLLISWRNCCCFVQLPDIFKWADQLAGRQRTSIEVYLNTPNFSRIRRCHLCSCSVRDRLELEEMRRNENHPWHKIMFSAEQLIGNINVFSVSFFSFFGTLLSCVKVIYI